MKKILCLLFAAIMVLSITACGGSPTTKEPETKTPGNVSVGFGRVDITPPLGTVITGMGNAGVGERKAVGVLKELYLTCIAVTDTNDNTILLFTVDIQSFYQEYVQMMQEAVTAATGLAKEQMS